MSLRNDLEEEVTAWEMLGNPCLFNRFLLRNGQEWKGARRLKPIGRVKMCFTNSVKYVRANPGTSYVEGLGLRENLIPIHHAWVVDNATNEIIETTWRLTKGEPVEYIGYKFDTDKLAEYHAKWKCYGLFSNDIFFNEKLIFSIDPELEAIVKGIMKNRIRWPSPSLA